MDSVTTLYGALIKGGITDGKQSVFYDDVLSVDLRENCSPASLGSIVGKVASVVLILGGIVGAFSGLIDGSIFNFVSGFAAIAFFWWCYRSISGLRKSIVIVTTEKGKKKLVYPQMEFHYSNLGREVAEVLNQRKGRGCGTLPTDMLHVVFSHEGEKTQFFRIDGDFLSIHDLSGDTACRIDLREVARVEKKFRGFKPPKAGSRFSKATIGSMEDDVIFLEDSGQESLHFVAHLFDAACNDDPAQELVDAVNLYLTSKAGLIDQGIVEERANDVP